LLPVAAARVVERRMERRRRMVRVDECMLLVIFDVVCYQLPACLLAWLGF
jgi:hypothetical protein